MGINIETVKSEILKTAKWLDGNLKHYSFAAEPEQLLNIIRYSFLERALKGFGDPIKNKDKLVCYTEALKSFKKNGLVVGLEYPLTATYKGNNYNLITGIDLDALCERGYLETVTAYSINEYVTGVFKKIPE